MDVRVTQRAQTLLENRFWRELIAQLLQRHGEGPPEMHNPQHDLTAINTLWALTEPLPANSALTLAQSCYPGELLALKLYLQIQDSAADALLCLQQNCQVLSTALRLQLLPERHGLIQLEVRIDTRACRQHQQAIVGFLADWLHQLGPEPGSLVAHASLPLGSADLPGAERQLGFNLSNSRHIGFFLHADQLQQLQHYRHPELLVHIGPALKRFKSRQAEEPIDLQGQVQQKILQLLPQGNASLEQVAQALSISSRHLRRKLGEHGASYEYLFEQTRKHQAAYLMGQTLLSLTEISYELGFNGPSSLTRACKRWFGASPSQYREQLRA